MSLIIPPFSVDELRKIPGRMDRFQFNPVMDYQDVELAYQEGDRLLQEKRPNVIRQVIRCNIISYDEIPVLGEQDEEYVFLKIISPDRGKYSVAGYGKSTFPKAEERADKMFMQGKDLAIAKIVCKLQHDYDPR